MNKMDFTINLKQLLTFPKTLLLAFVILFSSNAIAQPSGFVDQLFVGGWNNVVGMTFDDNGRIYVFEKAGRVWIVENGVKLNTPLLDISEEVGDWRDFGFLGFALDPNFLSNGYIYMQYTVDRHHLMNFGTGNYNPNTNEYFSATIGRITRYTAQANTGYTTVDYNSRKVLVGETKETGIPSLHESHGIGGIVFGTDGTLIASAGDGASYNSVDQGSAAETYYSQALADGIIRPDENVGAYRCQKLNSLNGKILRIDPETGDGVPSNPFYQSSIPRSAQSRVWARGVRNPYRITKQPNTGSHIQSEGNPGVFYFGDVGWGNREELNIIHTGGLNFGWPKFEGMTFQPGYNNNTYNPSSHERPKVDWRTGSPRALVNGSIFNVGSAQVPGPTFNGNASTGGVFYQGHDFPAEYHDTYFHADYGADWIRHFSFDANRNPTKVEDFISNGGPIVFLASDHNFDGLFYVRYPNEIRRVIYNGTGNQDPIATITSNQDYGPSPLNIQFNGDQSFDPENSNLTYAWNFGDGGTSSAINPTHTYTQGNGNPNQYIVTLTVTDNQGNQGQATKAISINNTPPVIVSTSVDNTTSFNPNNSTTLNLNAVVNDAEHNASQLTYAWSTALYHNNHFHAEPVDNNVSTSTILSPIGCDGATYWYRITLKVTDAAGLSTEVFQDIYPNCSGANQTINFGTLSNKLVTDPSFSVSATATSGLPVTIYSVDGPASITNGVVTLQGIPGTVTLRAIQSGDNSFAPATPVERSFEVTAGAPLTCTSSGTITFEKWTGISGVSISDIPVNTTPNSTSEINQFEIPFNVDDNYGVRVRGYFCAPQTGSYKFWISSDDNGELWISSNNNPANKSLVASVPGWTNPQDWDKYPQQESSSIFLVKDQKYYIEALMKEAGGGDNLAVGWQLPNGTLERPMLGTYLSPFSAQQNQTISFPAISNKLTTDNPFALNATASSGLPVTYTIVSGPASVSGNTITLTGQAGSVTVRASQGGNSNYNAAPNVNRTFQVTVPQNNCSAAGNITFETWTGIAGTSISDIPLNTTPDNTTTLNVFEIPVNAMENYGARVRGYFCAPQTGNYTFWISSDDQGELYVSTNDNPANKSLIANVPTWTNSREWNKFPEQQSAPVALVQGETYYVEALMKEGLQGDNLAVGWQLPSGTLERPIGGSHLSPWVSSTQNQTITFNTLANKLTTDPAFTISASASSGLPVSFTLVSGPASLSGNTVTLNGSPGTVTIRASQAGNANYNAAPNVTRSFTVSNPSQQNQTITFNSISDKVTTDGPFNLSASATSGLTVSFTVVSGPATVSGNTVTLTGGTGTVTIRASQAGNASYNPAPNVNRSFNVTTGGGPSTYCNSIGNQPWQEWIEKITFGSIDNSSFKDLYGDYTNLATDVTQGLSYPIVLDPGISWSGHQTDLFWRVWIDFNQDGDFTDSGEKVVEANNFNNTVNANISIPSTASLGQTRMRISMKKDAYSGPCESFNQGEVEDYTVNVLAGGGGPTCSNVTSGGTISGNQTSCDPFDPSTISNVTTPSGGSGGLEYQWQQSTNSSSGPWSNAGGNSSSFNPGQITQTHWYRRRARRSGCTSYAGISNVITKTVDNCPPMGQYCSSIGNQPWVEWINNVTFGTIDNTSFKERYGDFTNLVTQASQGANLPIDLNPGLSWFGHQTDLFWRVWIDFNMDGDFTDAGELVVEANNGRDPVAATVSIPPNAVVGLTRMRVSMKKDSYAGPCESFGLGEVEDYSVNITPNATASPFLAQQILSLEAERYQMGVQLDWMTNTGYKNDFFVIERAANGVDFEELDIVTNIYPGQEAFSYSFYDEDPLMGNNFYQIKQVHKDGSYKYSSTQLITFNGDENLVVFPNPTRDELFLSLKKHEGQPASIQIYNTLGQLMENRIVPVLTNDPEHFVLDNYTNGIYHITVKLDGRKRLTAKFVVSKL